MVILRVAAAAIAAYLLGSVNSAVIVSKCLYQKDIRTMGSGNAGLTNTLRVLGKKAAVLVLAGDVLKGVAAALTGRFLAGNAGAVCTLLFVVLGHMFPVYFGFRGGKGVLCGAAALVVISWKTGLCVLAVFLVLTVLTRYVSLGSLTAAALMPVGIAVFVGGIPLYLAVSGLTSLLIIFMHRGNIRRLCEGTEPKLSVHRE